MEDWKKEVHNARRSERWSLKAPNRIVKAVPVERPIFKTIDGFITVESSLIGRTPRQMEVDLGLPSNHFARGCRVYALKRLPNAHEFEYELTADHPDGLAFDEFAAVDEILRRRHVPSHSAQPIYAPGKRSIHQWRLLEHVPAMIVIDLLPGVAYPRP